MIAKLLMKRIVPAVGESKRSPVLRRPNELGMEYEDITFQSDDGLPLSGWYIPSKAPSNKIVISNHFSPGNKYGYAGHIKPWKGAGGFEVNFLSRYKALVEAGYNVFAYDFRGHGMSTPGQGGAYNPKFFEYKDVIGSMDYINSRLDTKDMDVHLFSMCLGGNSTLAAMKKRPDLFKDVKSMMLLQPISGDALVRKLSKNMRLGQKGYDAFEKYYRELFGYSITDAAPIDDAKDVKIPTFVAQVRKDSFTYAEEDVQAVYDAIPVNDKKLYWIEGTTQRFKGYTYFSEHPEPMIEWYNKH